MSIESSELENHFDPFSLSSGDHKATGLKMIMQHSLHPTAIQPPGSDFWNINTTLSPQPAYTCCWCRTNPFIQPMTSIITAYEERVLYNKLL